MSTRAKVAVEKREHPERFCKAPGCLWRVMHPRGGHNTPCPKHEVPFIKLLNRRPS